MENVRIELPDGPHQSGHCAENANHISKARALEGAEHGLDPVAGAGIGERSGARADRNDVMAMLLEVRHLGDDEGAAPCMAEGMHDPHVTGCHDSEAAGARSALGWHSLKAIK